MQMYVIFDFSSFVVVVASTRKANKDDPVPSSIMLHSMSSLHLLTSFSLLVEVYHVYVTAKHGDLTRFIF